jgi:fluoride exporter
LAVNLLGSFILGAVAAAMLGRASAELVEIGLIDAFTTFTTCTFESHRLGEDQRVRLGGINLRASAIG